MPLIENPSYKAPFGLSGGHLQTIYPTLFRKQPSMTYKRERIETSDGDFLDLDWASHGKSKNLAILTHGLESSSNSKYICGMAAAFQRRGWHALAWNLRGCSGEMNRSLTSYHCGSTGDLETVIEHTARNRGYESIVLIGFSLGGNITLKYIGDLANSPPKIIKAGVAFSVATDLAASAIHLERADNRIYMDRFLKTLTEKVRIKMEQFPNQLSNQSLDRIRTFREFDGTYTAPLNGFDSAEDYWARSSCGSVLRSISIPTLLVNASNDPFLPESCYPKAAANDNANLHLEIPSSGGHMGFVTKNKINEYWSERRAYAFVEQYT